MTPPKAALRTAALELATRADWHKAQIERFGWTYNHELAVKRLMQVARFLNDVEFLKGRKSQHAN